MSASEQAGPIDGETFDRAITLDEFKLMHGQVVGKTDWFVVDQELVDKFAEVTRDQQYIHVDPEKARDTVFGGTIAHGFLLLSLLSAFHMDAVPPLKGVKVAINAGFNRVRFVSPVKTGSRIRAVFVLAEIDEQKPGQWQTVLDVEVQIDGMPKPAMVAEWIIQWVF